MMPDRAKKMNCNGDQEKPVESGFMPTAEETIRNIESSIASLLNVDELVERALANKVAHPGSEKREGFQDVVKQWAGQLNDENFGVDSLSTSIGTQCSSCEYRLENPSDNMLSGFHICWEKATGIKSEELHKNRPVVDLHGNTAKSVKTFFSEGKYTLSDLSAQDFDLSKEGVPIEDGGGAKKKTMRDFEISRYERQWYQVQSNRRKTEKDTLSHPQYIIKRKCLEQEMNQWQFPLHFIDFETIAPVIPYYSNMSPYETFAFQFSQHIMSKNDDGLLEVRHASEFLHTGRGGDSPVVAFLEALFHAIGNVPTDGGTVFQWSPHEQYVLRTMLSSPEVPGALSSREISALSAILDSGMVDLCKLAQKYYYVDGSEGSSSIKRLLKPTLNASAKLKNIYGSPTYNGLNFKNFQWHQLDDATGYAKDPYDILSGEDPEHNGANVTKGGAAAAAFSELQNNKNLDEQSRKAIENSLLRYCELDTLAMVMIVQAWQGFLNDE